MPKRAGRKSAAQTPAPTKERIKGSKTNIAGSAASKTSAKSIELSDEIITALKNKIAEFNKINENKVNLSTLKAVYRRGAGAYSSTHRPTITGGAPNTRNAWAMARVNKFLEKKAGKKVKKAYVQDDDLLENGGEINEKETYQKWKSLVNMSKSELKRFYDSEEGKEAGLSSSKAKELGIDSGRESARWIMKMKSTPVSEWTPTMWKWAKKQISFVSRMRGNKGKLYDDNGQKTRKHTSLLIWGHNPEKYVGGGEVLKANDLTELNQNVLHILSQYGSRKMANLQVRDYLNENIELAKEWLKQNEINNEEELYKYLNKIQVKERAKVHKERKEVAREYDILKAEKSLQEIENLALLADEEMQRKINDTKNPDIRYDEGGEVNGNVIVCQKCFWSWLDTENTEEEKFICHKCNTNTGKMIQTEFTKGEEYFGSGILFYCGNTNKCLIIKRSEVVSEPNTWGIAGGGMEDGETFETCAKRECIEEIGYEPKYPLVKLFTLEEGNLVFVTYLCYTGEEFVPNLNYESSEYMWVSPNELPENLQNGFKVMAKDLQNSINDTITNNDFMKLKTPKTLNEIAEKHNVSLEEMQMQLENGIKHELEHTEDSKVAETIALHHLDEMPDYYVRLDKIMANDVISENNNYTLWAFDKDRVNGNAWNFDSSEELTKYAQTIDLEQNNDVNFEVRDRYNGKILLNNEDLLSLINNNKKFENLHEETEDYALEDFIKNQNYEAECLLFSDNTKLAKVMICQAHIDLAKNKQNEDIEDEQKLAWNEVKNVWEGCMDSIKNQKIYSENNVIYYKHGGLAYGNSHDNGGIPLVVKSTGQNIEIEGGEGVINKRSMQMTKKLEFEGKKMTPCQIISKINEMGGGVKFKCDDVKEIIAEDGNY